MVNSKNQALRVAERVEEAVKQASFSGVSIASVSRREYQQSITVVVQLDSYTFTDKAERPDDLREVEDAGDVEGVANVGLSLPDMGAPLRVEFEILF